MIRKYLKRFLVEDTFTNVEQKGGCTAGTGGDENEIGSVTMQLTIDGEPRIRNKLQRLTMSKPQTTGEFDKSLPEGVTVTN